MATTPEPKSRMLPGSGEGGPQFGLSEHPQGMQLVVLVPRIVNDSDGMVPMLFSEASAGPEFSSQYTGSPVLTLAFCRLSQYVPGSRSCSFPKSAVSVHTLNPKALPKQLPWLKL